MKTLCECCSREWRSLLVLAGACPMLPETRTIRLRRKTAMIAKPSDMGAWHTECIKGRRVSAGVSFCENHSLANEIRDPGRDHEAVDDRRNTRPYRLKPRRLTQDGPGGLLCRRWSSIRPFSRHATAVSVLFYDDPRRDPIEEIVLDPVKNRFGDLWKCFCSQNHGWAGLCLSRGWTEGTRPIALIRMSCCSILMPRRQPAIVRPRERRNPHSGDPMRTDPNASSSATSSTGRETGLSTFPWPTRSFMKAHVRGLTAHPSAATRSPGMYLRDDRQISYLSDLGITTVELLPIHEFDYLENPRRSPIDNRPLVNFGK